MATGGEEKVGYSLAKVGTLELENTVELPDYISIVVCQDKIVVLDWETCKVYIHRLQDGKCLASDRLESEPRDMCLMDAMTICVLDGGGLIKMMSIDSTDMSRVFTTTWSLRLQGVLDRYLGVVRFNNNLVVTGRKRDTMYWCIVSLEDGHVDGIHQICKGYRLCRVTTKDNIIYISCYAGYEFPDNGVYGFDILNPSQCKYTYKHQRLQWPTSIVINEDGDIFVCNNGLPDYCIHQLTASCQLVAIFTQGIPSLQAIFWDNGRLYGTCIGSHDIAVFKPVYQGAVIPVEILRMDNKSLQLYKKALRDGKEKIYNIRVMVVGQFGVGKTTLTKRLLGKPVYISERKSTEGISVYKHCCKISLDTGEWIVQHEDSDQLSRLQRLMKLLSGPDQKSDVSQEQEGHRDVVYERETTPEADNTQMSEAASSSRSDQEDQLTYSQTAKLSAIKMDGGHGIAHSDQETSTVTVTKSEAESSNKEKKDAVIEILHLINENADKLEKDIVKYAALSIWDFAGQYAFYTTHQTFLTSRALYLLVIDLNQQITDLIKDDKCFLDTDGIKLCRVHDLVEIWMNSIHVCASSPEASIPHVVLVGTHVDKLSEKSRKEVIDKYFKELRYILKDKPTIRHLMDDIAIDNTQSDPMLEILKRKIFELASQQPHWGEERPARWLPLEQKIMTLKASGAKVVARSLIEEINMSGSVRIEDSDELDLFLIFHHEMGTILYFSVEGLREKIVLDPQWLIDALKSLITAETFIKKYPAITSKWYEFEETGKLTHELIDAIWTEKNNQEFLDNKDHILLLMEKLNIIARPRTFTEDGNIKESNYFLAPCMLQRKAPAEVICPKPNDQMGSSSVLCFVFTGNFMPSPIFHRLLAACVAHWPIATKNKEEKQENQIFCGCCVFELDSLHNLTLHFKEFIIFVRVTKMGIKDKTPSSKLCTEVREFINTNLLKIIGYLGQSLKFEYFIQCPENSGESVNSLIPVSQLKENAEVRCKFHNNVIESCNLLKFWFEDKEQTGDVDASRVNKTKRKAKQQTSEKLSSTKRKRKRISALKGLMTKKFSNTSQSDVPDKAEITGVKNSKKTGVSCSDPELLCQVLKKSTQVASSSRRTLEENCQRAGLKFHGETPGNGNCFFEAVSSQLQRLNCTGQKSPQQLRQDVVAYMKANTILQGSEGTINFAEFISDGNFNDYCERMAQDGEWADHVVVVGMARMLQTDIMIVTSAPSSGPDNIIAWVVGQTNFNGQPILLGHIWECHYQSLQPINRTQGTLKPTQKGKKQETIKSTEEENQKAPEILESDARKCPVTAETFTQTEQGFGYDTCQTNDHGFVCCEYDQDNISGTPLLHFAENSIKYACKTAVVMTKEAFKSGFVEHEIQMALQQGFHECRKYVVPVLLQDCTVPDYLRILNYVDARNPNQRDIWWPKLVTELQTERYILEEDLSILRLEDYAARQTVKKQNIGGTMFGSSLATQAAGTGSGTSGKEEGAVKPTYEDNVAEKKLRSILSSEKDDIYQRKEDIVDILFQSFNSHVFAVFLLETEADNVLEYVFSYILKTKHREALSMTLRKVQEEWRTFFHDSNLVLWVGLNYNKRDEEPTLVCYHLNDIVSEASISHCLGLPVLYRHFNKIEREPLEIRIHQKYQHMSLSVTQKCLIKQLIQIRSEELFSKHSNLEAISASSVISSKTRGLVEKTSIIFYCRLKGVIPFGESFFPRKLMMEDQVFPTDVREGFFSFGMNAGAVNAGRPSPREYINPLKMGCSVGNYNLNSAGTLGPFARIPPGRKGFLTCAHVFGVTSISVGNTIFAVQPGNGEAGQQQGRDARQCGFLERVVFDSNGAVGVDAALVQIDDIRRSIDPIGFVWDHSSELDRAGFSETFPPSFQHGSVIERLDFETAAHNRVIKCGRTTGLTKGSIALNGCAVRIHDAGLNLPNGMTMNNQISHIMKGQYIVESNGNLPFFSDGDSGSGVYLVQSGNRLALVGIAIGSLTLGECVVTPIGAVLNALCLNSDDVMTEDDMDANQ